MREKDEIKGCLITNLEAILDPYMVESGFKRRKASLIYKRQIEQSTQVIDIVLQIHPKDQPDSAAAVYPSMEIFIPAADRVLKEMVGENIGLLEGTTGGISKQPIGFTSNKEHAGRWFIFQPESMPNVVESIKDFIDRWTLPLLNVYATPQDILRADAQGDTRLARDRAQSMRVVAAALACGRRSDALARLEKSFGTLGLRRRYQQVFEYVLQAV